MFKGGKSKWFLSVLVVVLLFGFSAGDGFSEITEKYDEFNESTTYSSNIKDVSPWYYIGLTLSKKDGDFVEKSLVLMLVEDEWHFFASRNLKMKLDGEMINVKFAVKDSDAIGNDTLSTSVVYTLQNEQLKKIKNANDVILRVFMKNVQRVTWEVPDKVLKEWKELIEKSGVLK